MSNVTVTIKSPSREARLSWDGETRPLAVSGSKTYTAVFKASPGHHDYAIMVWGAPGEKWTAVVEDEDTKNEHVGHMSRAGGDTTGDTPFDVG